MPRGLEGLQICERKAREAVGYASEAPEELRKQIFQEIKDLDETISGEEMELLEKKRILEEWLKEGRNAEVEEGRVTVAAGGGVTRQAAAGSRNSEAEFELWRPRIGTAQVGMERLHKSALQWLNAGGVQFVEDLGLAKTLRSGHCLWRRAPFLNVLVRADHSRSVSACWRAEFFFFASKHARACVPRALRAIPPHALDKPHPLRQRRQV